MPCATCFFLKKKKKVLIDLHALLKWDSMQDTMQRLLVIPETPKDLTCSSYDSTFLLLIPQRLFVLGNVFLHIRFNWLLSLSLLFFFLKCQRGGRWNQVQQASGPETWYEETAAVITGHCVEPSKRMSSLWSLLFCQYFYINTWQLVLLL